MTPAIAQRRLERQEQLYRAAAAVFRRHGYRGAPLKELAAACDVSIPALYRYFPSKADFALWPLDAGCPTLDRFLATWTGDPLVALRDAIDLGLEAIEYSLLAMRLARELDAGLTTGRIENAFRRMQDRYTTLCRAAFPTASEDEVRATVRALVGIAFASDLTGEEPRRADIRGQVLRALRGEVVPRYIPAARFDAVMRVPARHHLRIA